MKILLLGEYSNVHNTLAKGLRELGHTVTVASDGDHWKNYHRDIDLARRSLGKLETLRFLIKLKYEFYRFRGYDVVQIINPVFLDLKAERIWPYYEQLRKYNRSVFMGAFGMDYYYATACLGCKTFKYSDFNFGSVIRESHENNIWIHDWVQGEKGKLNRWIADDCDGIVAGLYEYYASYIPFFSEKLAYIPFPIELDAIRDSYIRGKREKVNFFIGIQRGRSAYKGTDIMLRALERIVAEYPDDCEMTKVESVPFDEYRQLMRESDVILDQLYSYTPAMNALEAMAQGLIVVGGGEPENYEILGEEELFPIVNVQPTEKSVYEELKKIVSRKSELASMSECSRLYIKKHHDHIKVAKQYIEFWLSKMHSNG